MSDFLGQAQGAADGVLAAGSAGFGWRAGLRRASFRGAAFLVTEHQAESGRRVVAHEFPLRETGFTEDLGKATPRRRP
jgi:prophage DNA circulation protein